MIRLVADAVRAGARQEVACQHVGLQVRTLQRWRKTQEDRRCLAKRVPENRLSLAERARLLEVVNSPEFRDSSPKQIVPKLADRGVYLASESTMYRCLRQEGQLKHRAASRPPTSSGPREHIALGPNQVWSWDITYLRSTVRGAFYYLYLVEDVWSRKIMGWAVHDRESPEFAAALIDSICRNEGIEPAGLVLHSDNGGPMKGATMLATLRRLGVVPSFSRPRVSDDNPFSEALFRTMKYRPSFPTKPFRSAAEGQTWVAAFVHWYNTQHLHSAIRFVTPADRHSGRQIAILARRADVYARARRRAPNRWSGDTRNWSPVTAVVLNPDHHGNRPG